MNFVQKEKDETVEWFYAHFVESESLLWDTRKLLVRWSESRGLRRYTIPCVPIDLGRDRPMGNVHRENLNILFYVPLSGTLPRI